MAPRKTSPPADVEALLGKDHGLSDEYVELLRDAHQHNWSDNTLLVYEKLSGYFDEWCGEMGFQSLPAHPAVVSLYLCKRASAGKSVSTLRCSVAAIGYCHVQKGYPSPSSNLGLQSVMGGLARMHGRMPRRVHGITAEEFVKIAGAAREPRRNETVAQAERRAALDLSLISFMRDGLLRRGEAAAARWRDLQVVEAEAAPGGRRGVLTIPFSKNDPTGEGAVVLISGQTLDLLDRMRDFYPRRRRARMGRIFPIGARQMANVISAAAKAAGLSGAYSGHSPRVGMVVDLVDDGVEKASLMKEARWSSERMISVYTRDKEVSRGAVAKFHERNDARGVQVRTLDELVEVP